MHITSPNIDNGKVNNNKELQYVYLNEKSLNLFNFLRTFWASKKCFFAIKNILIDVELKFIGFLIQKKKIDHASFVFFSIHGRNDVTRV